MQIRVKRSAGDAVVGFVGVCGPGLCCVDLLGEVVVAVKEPEVRRPPDRASLRCPVRGPRSGFDTSRMLLLGSEHAKPDERAHPTLRHLGDCSRWPLTSR
jgi:hypothetical protein